MQEDNIYKGTFYNGLNEPADRKVARKREDDANKATVPVIEEAVQTLKTNIEAYSRLPAIPDDILNLEDKEALAFRNQVAINKQTVANLIPIAEKLEDIIAQFKR